MTHAAPLPPLETDGPLLVEARTICADRAAARGHAEEAARYHAGENDQGWAIRHEVYRLKAERRA